MEMMSDEEIEYRIRHRVLDRVPFSFGVDLERSWLETVSVSHYVDTVSDRLSAEIHFGLPGAVLSKSIDIPFTWWDKFKVDMFPQWLLDIFPPQYESVRCLNVYCLFPKKKFGDTLSGGRDGLYK